MESNFKEFDALVEDYLESYVREFGERSAEKTIRTIKNSKHSANLLNQSASKRAVPNAGDFNSFILSNLSLSFSKTSKVRFASIILLWKWHNEVQLPLN